MDITSATFLVIWLCGLVPGLYLQHNENVYFPIEEGFETSKISQNFQSNNETTMHARFNTPYEEYVEKVISTGILRFTIAINRILGRNTQQNVLFSPISITGALGLVLLGSNGKTFKEIIDVMGYATEVKDIESRPQVVHESLGYLISKLVAIQVFSETKFASGIFVQKDYPIRQLYKKTAEELYSSEVLNVDFRKDSTQAQKYINEWIKKKTKGKILDLVQEPPSSLTRVIIASAMYFNARWEYPFFEGGTTRRRFYVNGRGSHSNIKVEMMANGGQFPYYKDDILGCEILGYPYSGNRSTMYVVMPMNSNKGTLKALEKKLTPSEIKRLVSSMRYTPVVTIFPKMKLESTIDLKQSLQDLGIHTLFTPKEANLALISQGEKPEHTTSGNSTFRSNKMNGCSAGNNGLNGNSNCLNATSKNLVDDGAQSVSNKVTGLDYETLDNMRQLINKQNSSNDYQNPGLHADQVIHKAFIDITESGTEAAAATAVSLARDGNSVSFRVDVPFLFFIRHEETEIITFWGSVVLPEPHFKV